MLFAYGNSIGKRMKILYFGYGDEAAENILQQLVKEGHKVSCVISNARKAKKIKCKVYEYQLSKFDTQIQSVMKFVKPDAIVFAGRIMDNKYLDEQMGDFTQMQRILQCAEENAVRKFVYLSSLESIQDDEKSMTDWGVYHAQQECNRHDASQEYIYSETFLPRSASPAIQPAARRRKMHSNHGRMSRSGTADSGHRSVLRSPAIP